VVPLIGRKVFSRSTGEEDPHKAFAKSRPWLATWEAEIAAARDGTMSPRQRQVRDLHAYFRQTHREDPGHAMDYIAEVVLPWLEETFAKDVPAGEWNRAMQEHNGDQGAALLEMAPAAGPVLDQIMDHRTPFLEHMADWKAQLAMKARARDEYARDVERFGKGRHLESLTGRQVQRWIEERVQAGDSAATVQRRLSAIRNYWGWLQSHEHVADDFRPFDGRRVPNTAPKQEQRRHFKVAEVEDLHRAALARGDKVLADLIVLAFATGGRIDELCSLRLADVTWEQDGAVVRLASKTEAGRRVVPIVKAVEPALRRLLRDAQAGTWLIHSDAQNKYGNRSSSLSKRFARLRTQQGHGPDAVFHSIRKTLATLLKNAGCPEPIAADILGHEIETMSYGVYAGGTDMATRRQWLKQVVVMKGIEGHV
jgi:integrase